MKIFSTRRRKIAAAVLILLFLFLLRPGASRLKSRIIASISSAVARPVDIGSVHFRILPRPGFDLENLVVYDDPAFGAEPILRASEVTAALRLTSLLRGRLEIAHLELTEPSLNLVHGVNGGWNLEALIERTAHASLAPTAKAKSEPRPAFPYIQASSARINFKQGSEKKPYALINADFSLWQDSENAWGLRLKAQPTRTDLNLSDTGILQVNGTWQRAGNLRDTPLDFRLEWSRAQLGQLTKLFTGSDKGWRGGVQLDATLHGMPSNLQIASDASIQDFRRYDITAGEALKLAGHCDAHYSAPDHLFGEIACRAPVASGEMRLTGSMGLPGSHHYQLVLTAADVPASAAATLVERAKKNLPEDLVVTGTVQGAVTLQEDGAAPLQLSGKGEIEGLRLASATGNAAIGPVTIPIAVSNGALPKNFLPTKSTFRNLAQTVAGPHLEFGPFLVAIGRASAPTASAPTARGWIDRTGYHAFLNGEAEIAKTLRAAGIFGLPALQTTADGTADVDLQVGGAWAGTPAGFSPAQITGIARLRNVQATLRGTLAPVEISSAELQFFSDAVLVAKLNARAADTQWTGSLEMPRGCGVPSACEFHFKLNASQISLTALTNWVSPRKKSKAWYELLGSSAQSAPNLLATLRATGQLTIGRLEFQNIVATHASATLNLDKGKLQIPELSADFLSGRYLGDWQADFTTTPWPCSGNGSLTGISLAQLADMTKYHVISGTASAAYEIKGECTKEDEFWTSAEGSLQFEVRDGNWPRVSLADNAQPLKIVRLSARARLADGKFDLTEGMLESPGGKFQLSGTASLNRQLDLKLARTASSSGDVYAIRGTLLEPHVVSLPGAEQAQLKSEPK